MKHQFKPGDRARLVNSPFTNEKSKNEYPVGTEIEIVDLTGTLPEKKLAILGLPHQFFIGWKKVGEKEVFIAFEEDLERIN